MLPLLMPPTPTQPHLLMPPLIKRKIIRRVVSPPPPPLPEEKSYFSPDEIKAMNNHVLAKHFIRITGCSTLSCTHCKGAKPIVPYWMESIRTRCEKKGLSVDIKLPKTCDQQQSRNKSCNPFNNPAYSKLRSGKLTEEEKVDTIAEREENLLSIGLTPKPYRYRI